MKFFCENDGADLCSKCIVVEHKGHNITYMGQSIEYLIRSKELQIEFMRGDIEAAMKARQIAEDSLE